MVRKLRDGLSFANVASALALFFALSSGTAVALGGANTVFSDDVVDGQIRSADLGSNQVGTGHIGSGQVTGGDVRGNAIGTAHIAPGHVTNADLGTNAVTGVKVLDGTLTGIDVAEHTLGPVPTADNGARAFRVGRTANGTNVDPVTLTAVPGLTIRLACVLNHPGITTATFEVETPTAGTANWTFNEVGGGHHTEGTPLAAAQPRVVTGASLAADPTQDDQKEGRIIVSADPTSGAPNGRVFTVDLHAYARDGHCEATGTIVSAPAAPAGQ